MASKLNKAAYDQSFTDRVAELAVIEKRSSSVFNPVYRAAEGVADPLVRKELGALGQRVARDSSSSDFWTALKNRVLTGYGQLRDLDKYPDKEKAFTAIGATARPRIDMAKKIMPVLGAGATAGAAGLYLGDEHHQQALEQAVQNEPLMERIKFLISPRKSTVNYFLNQQKQSAAAPIPSVLAKILGRIVEPTMGAAIGGIARGTSPSTLDQMKERGFANRASRGVARGALTGAGVSAGSELGARAGSRIGARLMMQLAKNPESAIPASLIGSVLGLAGGGTAGAIGGGAAGYELGGIGQAKPTMSERLRFGLHQAEKSSFHKGAAFGRMLGYGLRKGLGALPVVGSALGDVAHSGFRGIADAAGGVAGRIGVPLQNAGRAMARRGNLFHQNFGQGWEIAAGRTPKPIQDPMTNPGLQPLTQKFDASGKPLTPYPATRYSRRLGGLATLGMAGAATMGAGAAADPGYRDALAHNNVFTGGGLRELKNLATSGDEFAWAASQFGLPMEESGPGSVWHRPTIFNQ